MANENKGYTYLDICSARPISQVLNLGGSHVEPTQICTFDAQIPCSLLSAANTPIDSLL